MAMPAPRGVASVLLVASAISACAGDGPSPTTEQGTAPTADPAGAVAITIAHTPAGIALAGPNGKTLYIRTNDRNGTSACSTGPCSRAWPALVSDPAALQVAPGITGTFGITIWGDGTQQVTHNGQPLYFYSEDAAAGEARGEGIAGVWCIARITASPGCGTQPAPEATLVIPGPAQRAAESAEDY
jgi:predicted lipoprotein with Yx(FWY)xxD motif